MLVCGVDPETTSLMESINRGPSTADFEPWACWNCELSNDSWSSSPDTVLTIGHFLLFTLNIVAAEIDFSNSKFTSFEPASDQIKPIAAVEHFSTAPGNSWNCYSWSSSAANGSITLEKLQRFTKVFYSRPKYDDLDIYFFHYNVSFIKLTKVQKVLYAYTCYLASHAVAFVISSKYASTSTLCQNSWTSRRDFMLDLHRWNSDMSFAVYWTQCD